MKTSLQALLVFLMMVFLAIPSVAQVKSDFDKSTDFSKYKTYRFHGWVDHSDEILNDFDKKRILEAFRDELNAMGLQHSEDNSDIAITLYIVVDQKTSMTAYSNYNGGMGYGYGRWGWGMGMGSTTTTYSENDYLEGTVVIDFYDDETKQLIWQGIMTTTVKENPKQREKAIPKNVKKLMAAYPGAAKGKKK